MIKRIKPKALAPLMLKAVVYATYDPALRGVITQLGPEVSEVKLTDGPMRFRFIPNSFLRVLEGESKC